MEIRKIRIFNRPPTKDELLMLATEIERALLSKGYESYVKIVNSTRIDVTEVRLSEEYVNRFGHNRNNYSGRRGRILTWINWVIVNNTVNRILDRYDVSANVDSLHGRIIIRRGKESFSEGDILEHIYQQNIEWADAVRYGWYPDYDARYRELEDVDFSSLEERVNNRLQQLGDAIMRLSPRRN